MSLKERAWRGSDDHVLFLNTFLLMSQSKPHRFSSHLACQTLTGITLEHLPRDRSLGRRRRFSKGADVWRPNDHADRIYFLERGQVAVMTGDSRGHEVIMNVITEGEPFGEICFCSQEGGVQHTTARAIVPSAVLQIKNKEFVDYLHQAREVLTAFVFTLCERLSDAQRRIEVLSHRDAERRLGSLLLQLASTPGEKGRLVELRAAHEGLAQMAAMSRSHVTVTMGRFRRRKLVRYERKSPLVVDVLALTAYLGSL